MPSVTQSSSVVWSNVPGRTASLNARTVASSAAGSSPSLPASSPIVAALYGGNTGGMNLPIGFASITE
jgi:hypothetical protein